MIAIADDFEVVKIKYELFNELEDKVKKLNGHFGEVVKRYSFWYETFNEKYSIIAVAKFERENASAVAEQKGMSKHAKEVLINEMFTFIGYVKTLIVFDLEMYKICSEYSEKNDLYLKVILIE